MLNPDRQAGSGDRGPEFTSVALDRRRFLVVVGGAAALHALGPSWAFARKVARALPTLQPWSLPEVLPSGGLEAARALIGAAILAPSHWNAQPWRFEVDGGELRLVLDATRTLPLDDPDQRFAQMSLGAALENLLVAARAWGQQPTVRYLPWGATPRPGASLVAATVSWAPGEAVRDGALFNAIPARRSNPHAYDGRAIPAEHRNRLLAQVGEEVRVHWLEDRSDLRAVGELVHDAVELVQSDRRAQGERLRWLRDSEREAR
ncbi:MAG: hypothetical protein RL760_1560, partial [Candidatus Eisenbacteria bacterium]